MAEQQFTLVYSPNPGDNVTKDVVVTAAMVDPAPGEVWIGFGADVELRRTNEIDNAFQFLISGIRDRNLIDGEGFTSVVTAVDINRITAGGRRTSSDMATTVVTATDVVIAIGATAGGSGYKVMIETTYEQLRRAVTQWMFKNSGDVGGGGGGGGGDIIVALSLNTTQNAGSANDPAMIVVLGNTGEGGVATIIYDTDTTDPSTVGVPVTIGMTADELGNALCAKLVAAGVACEYQDGVLYISPMPPAQSVAVISSIID
jgi:hypothetical protein